MLTVTLIGKGTTNAASATTVAGTSSATATFAAFVSYDQTAGTITTAADNKSNTFTAVGTPQADPQGGFGRWYVCENGVGGSNHTFTFTTTNNCYAVVHLFEISATAGIPRLDINVQGQDTTSSPWDTVATGTLNYANEAILAGCLANSGLGSDYATSNMTLASSENNVASFWTSAVGSLIQSGTTTFSPSFSRVGDSAGAVICIVTFREESTDPAVGAHTHVGQEEGNGTSPVTTPSITTQVSGSSFITGHAGYSHNNADPTDSKSNTWVAYGTEIYNGYGGSFSVRMYLCEDGVGGSNHSVSFVKVDPPGEATVPFIEVKNADVLVDYAQNYPAAGTTLTSGDVTTTGPAVLVAFWWGDASGLTHTAVPNNDFTVIEAFLNLPPGSGVQMAVAAKEVAAAGTYNVTWTETPDQGAALWLFAFQKSGATGSPFDILLKDNGPGTFDVKLNASVQTVYIGAAGKAAVYLANSLEADMYKGALQLFP